MIVEVRFSPSRFPENWPNPIIFTIWLMQHIARPSQQQLSSTRIDCVRREFQASLSPVGDTCSPDLAGIDHLDRAEIIEEN